MYMEYAANHARPIKDAAVLAAKHHYQYNFIKLAHTINIEDSDTISIIFWSNIEVGAFVSQLLLFSYILFRIYSCFKKQE